MTDGEVVRFPALVAPVATECGQANLKRLVGELVFRGTLVLDGLGYRKRTLAELARLPPVRTIAPPEAYNVPDQVLLEALQRVLTSGVSYDLAELVRELRRTFPATATDQLAHRVEGLAAAGHIARVHLGSAVRYRKVPSDAGVPA